MRRNYRTPSFVNIRFIYMKISDNIAELAAVWTDISRSAARSYSPTRRPLRHAEGIRHLPSLKCPPSPAPVKCPFPVICPSSYKLPIYTGRANKNRTPKRRPALIFRFTCKWKLNGLLHVKEQSILSVWGNFNRVYFSPGDAPRAITLNVVWMEREFDAYKLSRCMCSSNYNRFWDRARYWSKIVIFSYPLAFDAPVRGGSRRNSPPHSVRKN